MAEIIPLKEKRAHREQQIDLKRRKQEAAEKFIRQAHPGAACEKCGTLLEHPEKTPRVPYVFCQSCGREYVEYIEHLKGRGDPRYYWHNETWLEMWRRWIDYQSVLDRYVKSKEFTRLLKEPEQSPPDT